MKIDKAIEILEDILNFVKPGDPPDEHDALKLGIEALKHLQYERDRRIGFWTDPINGETED